MRDKAFGKRIGVALLRIDRTQSWLAGQLHMRPNTIGDWINEGVLPEGWVILRLPRLLEVSGHWLLTGDEPMEPSVPAERAAVALRLIDEIAKASADTDRFARFYAHWEAFKKLSGPPVDPQDGGSTNPPQ